ncbi:hypothetical protein [Pseudomonas segetis]|uniref:Uncharacterized protein n=1 Tax=Pseudomonas segetis TaxID=298908 RepID=A0A239JMR1_9PSED|nr:hypothetical protein [Pseudomonas segetis]SNT07181.1 hypothetical protein SAMN05216255_4421 [Pseudomonas segetis]
MGKYTITISDESGAVSVGMEGARQDKTTAFFVAKALMRLVPDVVISAARAASKHGNCPCPKCEAERSNAAQDPTTDSKPTLH